MVIMIAVAAEKRLSVLRDGFLTACGLLVQNVASVRWPRAA